MGLPPEKLFYLYIPVGCLDSSLLLHTEGDSCCHGRSLLVSRLLLLCSVRTNLSVETGQLQGGSRLPTVWETFLTGSVWWLEFELHGRLALTRLRFVYIYNALQHFNIFYRTKGNRRITRMRQSIHFSHEHQNYSQAFFWRDIYLSVFSTGMLSNGTVPRPVVTFSVNAF